MTDTSFSNPFLFSPGQQVNNEEEQFWGNLQSALSHGGSPIKDTGLERTLNRIDTEERLVYEEIKKPSPMKLRAPDFLCQMNTSYSNLGKKQMHVSYRQEIERQNALLAQQKSRNTSYSC